MGRKPHGLEDGLVECLRAAALAGEQAHARAAPPVHTGGFNFAFGDASVREVFRGFTEDVLSAMQVGAYNEDWMNLPAMIPLPGQAAHPGNFTYDALGNLTRDYVSDTGLEQYPLGVLAEAEKAEEEGAPERKDAWLAHYAAVLQKVRGGVLPAVQADAMAAIARSL